MKVRLQKEKKKKGEKKEGWTCSNFLCLFLFHWGAAVLLHFLLHHGVLVLHHWCWLCLPWPCLRVKVWPKINNHDIKIPKFVLSFPNLKKRLTYLGKFKWNIFRWRLFYLGQLSFHDVSPDYPHPQDSELEINANFSWRKTLMHEMWRMNISCAISNSKDCFKLKRKLLVEKEKILAEHCKTKRTLTSISFLMLTEANSTFGVWRPASPELVMLNWLLFSSSLYP